MPPKPASVDADGATIEPHDLERNGEAQPFARAAFVKAYAAHAESGDQFVTDADTVVFDDKVDSVGVARAIYTDTAGRPLRRVLENDAG